MKRSNLIYRAYNYLYYKPWIYFMKKARAKDNDDIFMNFMKVWCYMPCPHELLDIDEIE